MIRPASADEASVLTKIAHDAKRHWGYPEHWIKHWESDLTISSDFIRDNHVYVAEEDGEAAVRVCGEVEWEGGDGGVGEVAVDRVAGEEGAEGVEEAVEPDQASGDGDAGFVGFEVNSQPAQHAAVVEFAYWFVSLHCFQFSDRQRRKLLVLVGRGR